MFDEAIIAYEKSIELNPTSSDAYHYKGMSRFRNIGNALVELKKYDEAIINYEIAI